MILEVVVLNIIDGQAPSFEKAFVVAEKIIASADGYIAHELQKCIDVENRYILLVKWQTIEHHMDGFRNSSKYQEWKALLHHFYSSFPTAEHYKNILKCT